MTDAPSQFTRIFTAARARQGFRDQAHLDAFFAFLDHKNGCAVCSGPGKGVWLDDGFQPTQGRCAEGAELERRYF